MQKAEAAEILNGGISVDYDQKHGAVFEQDSACFYTFFVRHENDNDIQEMSLKFTTRGLKFKQFINYNGTVLINFELTGKEYAERIIDAKALIAHEFALTPLDSKALVQFLYQAYHGTKLPITEKKDRIRIENGKIVVDAPDDFNEEKLKSIYGNLIGYLPSATKESTFVALFGHSIISPFFTYIRKHSIKKIKFPLILLHGPTGNGKTTTAEFFIKTGFDQEEKMCFFNRNNVKSDFTMSSKLSLTYNPAIIDEVDQLWMNSMLPFLKSYTQSISTASRGTPSLGLKEFEGKMAFVMTTNTSIRLDSDLALFKSRLFDIHYTVLDAERQNDDRFNNLLLSMEPGFMYYILFDLMNGKDVTEFLKDILYFKKDDFINYGIKKINESMKKFNLPEFPLFHEETDIEYSNVQEFVDKILSEDEKQNSFLSNEFKIEEYLDKIDIFFTGGCFKALNEHLRLPYVDATNFMRNISRSGTITVPDGEDLKSKKISRYAKKCFHLTVLKEKESKNKANDSDDAHSDSTKPDYKIENLPDGAVKQEFIERQEDLKNEEEKTHEKQVNTSITQKTHSADNCKSSLDNIPEDAALGDIAQNKNDMESEKVKTCKERTLCYKSKKPYTGAFLDGFKRSDFFYYKITTDGLDDGAKLWIAWVTAADSILAATFDALKNAKGSEVLPHE